MFQHLGGQWRLAPRWPHHRGSPLGPCAPHARLALQVSSPTARPSGAPRQLSSRSRTDMATTEATSPSMVRRCAPRSWQPVPFVVSILNGNSRSTLGVREMGCDLELQRPSPQPVLARPRRVHRLHLPTPHVNDFHACLCPPSRRPVREQPRGDHRLREPRGLSRGVQGRGVPWLQQGPTERRRGKIGASVDALWQCSARIACLMQHCAGCGGRRCRRPRRDTQPGQWPHHRRDGKHPSERSLIGNNAQTQYSSVARRSLGHPFPCRAGPQAGFDGR